MCVRRCTHLHTQASRLPPQAMIRQGLQCAPLESFFFKLLIWYLSEHPTFLTLYHLFIVLNVYKGYLGRERRL